MSTQAADPDAPPYEPNFAEEVKLIQGWADIAERYLTDTGNGNIKEGIALLELGVPLNMVAALSLLADTNKGKVVRNTRTHAEQLYKTEQVANREQTQKSFNDHYYLLQPDPMRFKDPELTMSYKMATIALLLVTMREEAHGEEFANVKGQQWRDLGVLVCIMFEVLLDHRDGAHGGYFVHKFGLPSTLLTSLHLNPSAKSSCHSRRSLFASWQRNPNGLRWPSGTSNTRACFRRFVCSNGTQTATRHARSNMSC
jgi:hypothetical protein